MALGDEIRQFICDHYIEPAFLLENNQKLFGLLQKLLYFAESAVSWRYLPQNPPFFLN